MIRILFLSANPGDKPQLKVIQEYNEIYDEFRSVRLRDQFELVQRHAVSIKDLQRILLEQEPQILHFSGHGSQESALIFQNEDGQSEEVSPNALAELFKILGKNIRCVVLNSCYSEKQAKAIAKHVDYVIGMVRAISDNAATKFAVYFYQALGFGKDIRDAFDLARSQLELSNIPEEETPKLLRKRQDLQFTARAPGTSLEVASMPLEERYWKELLYAIRDKKCTPFIGPGASGQWLPDMARKWADEHDYPLEDSSQLARVAQFLAIQEGEEMFPKNTLSREIQNVIPPDFRNTPYDVLADLNLPIYITTNYDYFMEEALKKARKDPVTELCRWNNNLRDYLEMTGMKSIFEKEPQYKPSESRPLVYHLHGDINTPESMVLTERDYLDFVINLNRHGEEVMLPTDVNSALAKNHYLFIGYSLDDISFRVIFQGVISLVETPFRQKSISVQVPEYLNKYSNKQAKVQQYLDKYTEKMFKVHVYWGDAQKFTMELRRRLDDKENLIKTTAAAPF